MSETIHIFGPYIVSAITLTATITAAGHVLLFKKDTKAAAGWVGLIWFSPLIGVLLYWLLGINRIKRRARIKLAGREIIPLPTSHGVISENIFREVFFERNSSMATLCHLTEKITRQPLMKGNQIEPLLNGDEAYPEMLSAIKNAHKTITLCSYIFDNDRWGKEFRKELKEAVARGVAVRVLVDAVGARYSFPSIVQGLQNDGIPVAMFMKTRFPWRFRYHNLRNHRKILVIDGATAFTGGMNIREGNVLKDNPSHPLQDIHFCVKGPVVAQLQRVFAEDWTFTTGEMLEGEPWYPQSDFHGDYVVRTISGGPDEDFDKLRMVLLGALSSARKKIRIVTPYFLPDSEITVNLRLASLRGVDVKIVLPEVNNLRMVQWASLSGLEELVSSGCCVYLSPRPFDHSKLLTVDEKWVLFGSANWDSRSLILNFELNLECYSKKLAETMDEIIENKIIDSRKVTLESLDDINMLTRLRNNLVRLFSPYL